MNAEPTEDRSTRSHTSTAQMVVLISIAVGMISIVGALFQMGAWKGSVDEKVNTFGLRLDKHEDRLTKVESDVQAGKNNTEFILKSLDEFRGETKARFDRQMERLDKISDHQTAVSQPRQNKP